jgi:hypothetical protein
LAVLEKLDTTIEKLFEEGKIKTKWNELEIHGIREIVNLLWQDEIEYGTIGQAYEIKNRTIYQTFYSGIPYKNGDQYETFVRAYIDTDNNIIFMSSKGELFMYETDDEDGADLKHFSRSE